MTDGLGNTRTSDFDVEPIASSSPSAYNLKTSRSFYYGNNAPVLENYTFFFEIYDLATNLTSVASASGSLSNAAPSITNCVPSVDPDSGATTLYTYLATNGSSDISGIPPANTLDLTFSKISQSPALPIVSINPESGILTEPTGSLNGNLDVVIQVQDASGAEGSLTTTCTTTFNGSQGILTRPTNNSWYNGNSLTINAGPESSGFYWSTNKTNEVSSTPIPGGNLGFRAPVNNQPTPTDTIGPNGLNDATINAQGACGGGVGLTDSWVWKNSNRNALAFDFENTNPSGLSSGTGYILVDFENKVTINGGPQSDKPSVIWPTYLQYRDSSAAGYPDNWVDAVDVEGRTIRFGGTQTNNYNISLDSARPDFTETGVTDQSTTAISSTQAGEYNNLDAMQSQTTGRTNASNLSLLSKGSRIFAFGKDQGYAVRPDYFGDYRLIVRYPYGDNVPNSLTSFGNKILPVLTPQGCPGQQGGSSINSPYASYASSLTTQLVKLSFGDFYKPLLDGSAPSYFSYRLSVNGSADIENAKSFVPSQVVYTREWSFRYITQLYTDPELSIPYTATTNLLYYSYSSTEDNSLNGKYGNEMSNTTNTAITGTDRAPVGAASNEDRRWVAQFDGNGKKMAQTAEPVIYDQEGTAPPLIPPAGTPPTYADGLLNTTGFGPFPQVLNNASGNTITVVWFGGASQTVFATTLVSNLTNGLGGETPAPFTGSFLKFYSADQSTGYAEVSTVSLNIDGNQSTVSYIHKYFRLVCSKYHKCTTGSFRFRYYW